MAPAVRSALQSIKVPVLIMAVSSELPAMKEATVSADTANCRHTEMPGDPPEFKGDCRGDALPAASARLYARWLSLDVSIDRTVFTRLGKRGHLGEGRATHFPRSDWNRDCGRHPDTMHDDRQQSDKERLNLNMNMLVGQSAACPTALCDAGAGWAGCACPTDL